MTTLKNQAASNVCTEILRDGVPKLLRVHSNSLRWIVLALALHLIPAPHLSAQRGGYQEIHDPAEADRTIRAIWRVLTTPACWDSNGFQYQFFDPGRYRYSGIEVQAGTIRWLSAGRHDGRNAAYLTTAGGRDYLVLVTPSDLYYTSDVDGRATTLRFRPSNRCL